MIDALRAGATRRARSVICGAPRTLEALEGDHRRDSQLRRLLADLETARRLLDALPAGEPLLYALRVVAPAEEVRRMPGDGTAARVEPALMVAGRPVLPDVYVPTALEGLTVPRDVEMLPMDEVRRRIRAIVSGVPCSR